ncbi:hypothetical protein AABM21_13660, partial [Enterococcus faecium]
MRKEVLHLIKFVKKTVAIPLSYREVQEILYDRGINVSHTTIYRWVQEYGKLLYQIWKKKNK